MSGLRRDVGGNRVGHSGRILPDALQARLDYPIDEVCRAAGDAVSQLGLEDKLESEIWPGKLLTEVPGVGEELAQRIHEWLGISILEEHPSVGLLLEIDEEYRSKAQRNQLRKIAPKRFNPGGEAWLPILRARRNGWSFTALFSNTALAHRSGKTDDWVVVYYERGDEQRQCTMVTAEGGKLTGRRVIRGRERECRDYYGL